MYTSPSGKCYIGQTMNEEKRRQSHRCITRSKTIFSNAIRKYGLDSMIYTVLHSGIETRKELDDLEELEIKNRNTLSPNGYNMRTGGFSAPACPWNNNQIFLISWNNTNKKMSEEAKKRIGIGNTGKVRSDDVKKQISKSLKKYYKKNKYSIFSLKYKAHEFYLSHPEAIEAARVKAKKQFEDPEQVKIQKDIKRHLMKKVKCVTTGCVYESLHDAAKATGCFRQGIKKCCDGLSPKTKNMYWEWA